MRFSPSLQFWTRLGKSRKIGALAGLVAAACFTLAIISATHDSRMALFPTPLRPDQVAEVSERLSAWNVVHAPSADNVRVDAHHRNELLLRLSLAGIPHDHIASSHELLAGVGALTPQSVIDVQTRAGLEGDMALALRGVQGVEDARVIIAPAQHGVFADETSQAATASVRLTLHSGVRLSPEAIAGMREFAAAAVPGLAPEHVTILDDRGIALRDSEGDGGAGSGELQGSLQSALDAAFGAGTSIVRVRMILDPRSREMHETHTEPVLKRAIAAARIDELFAGAGKRYSKTASQEERGRDVREERTRVPAGRLERVSVAVFVDGRHAGELEKIRALASAAAGIDVRRGDVITVEPVTFAAPAALLTHPWILVYGAIAPALPICFGAIVFLVVARFTRAPAALLVRTALRRLATVRSQSAVVRFAPHEVRQALDGEPPHTAAAVISALPAASAAAVLDLYPADERAAIVRRMARPNSRLIAEAARFG